MCLEDESAPGPKFKLKPNDVLKPKALAKPLATLLKSNALLKPTVLLVPITGAALAKNEPEGLPTALQRG